MKGVGVKGKYGKLKKRFGSLFLIDLICKYLKVLFLIYLKYGGCFVDEFYYYFFL